MKTAAPSRRDRMRWQFIDLKVPGAQQALDQVACHVDNGKLAAAEAVLTRHDWDIFVRR